MQDHGLRSDQVSEVRGYADQKLRKPEAPLDPSNRRISVIVQYLKAPPAEVAKSPPPAATAKTPPTAPPPKH
jgi:chemotaxis protein MotB